MNSAKLEEFATIVDCEHKTAPIDHTGDFFAVGTPAMRGNRIDYSEARQISEETFKAWTRRLKPQFNDILFAREAPVGPVVRIPKSENVAPGQRTVLIRVDDTIADSRFIFYLLSSPKIQSKIASLSAGSTVAHLNVADVRSLNIGILPPLREQQAIAEVLSSLDDKVATNDSTISSITALQSAFWDQATANIFKKPLGDFVESHLGGTPKRSDDSAWVDEVAWASVKDMSAAGQGIIVETTEGISTAASQGARRLNPLPSGSVFLSARGTVGLVTTNAMPCAINQSAYAFVPPEGKGPALRLAIESLIDRLRARAHGSTFSTITKQDLRESSIPDLNNSAVADLCPILNDLEKLRIAKAQESHTLTSTRDELLPLLMNGNITVADAEKLITE